MMLKVLCAMHYQPVQISTHPDLYFGPMLAYFVSPTLSSTVAGHNLQYWRPGHYWHAQFSLTTSTLCTGYFGY